MRALISGAASGIGLATASRLIDAGWQVVGLDCRPCPTELGSIEWIQCDLGDPAMTEATICNLQNLASRLDALVLSAGVAGIGEPERVLRINFIAARAFVRKLAPLVNDGGSIVVVSSAAGWRWAARKAELLNIVNMPDDQGALTLAATSCASAADAYVRSKELLNALVSNDCLVHWSRGVRLNSVSPGNVDTPLIADFSRSMGDEAMSFARDTVGRDGTASEIAHAIAFLCEPTTGWINGADLRIDGGLTGALAAGAARFAAWD